LNDPHATYSYLNESHERERRSMNTSKDGRPTAHHGPENLPRSGIKNTGQGGGNVLGNRTRQRAESSDQRGQRH